MPRSCWMCREEFTEDSEATDEHGDPVDLSEPAPEDGPDLIFCTSNNGCLHEFRCSNAEAAHFEDAAYGTDY